MMKDTSKVRENITTCTDYTVITEVKDGVEWHGIKHIPSGTCVSDVTTSKAQIFYIYGILRENHTPLDLMEETINKHK